jgi:hypothetical protein
MRLWYAAFETLVKMAEGGLVQGVGVKPEAFRALKTAMCEPCILGKQTRAPFLKQSDSPPTTEPLQLIHMDVCGPMHVASKGGKRYLATYLDDYSKLSVVEPIQFKSDVVSVIEAAFARLELQLGKKVKAIQTRRGGKYVNKEMKALLSKKGIVHRKSAENAPEQNDAAERLNRDLQEKERAMLADSKLGPKLWTEALVNANYTCNRLLSSVHGKTPYDVFHGKVLLVSHMRVFGVSAYMLIPKERREKMQPVSERAIFLGYEADSKAYRVQRVRDGGVMISRELVVNESATSLTVELSSGAEKGSEGACGLSRVSPLTQMGAGDTSTEESGTQPGAGDTSAEESGTGRGDRGDRPSARNRVQHTGTGAVQGQPAAAVGQQGQYGQRRRQQGQSKIDPRGASDGEAEGDNKPRCYPARTRVAPLWFRLDISTGSTLAACAVTSEQELSTYQEAVGREDGQLWRQSIDEEMRSLLENGTWELAEGVRPVPPRWVYEIKRDAQGNIDRYKSRVVAKGYLQRQGVDFEELYAPVSSTQSSRRCLHWWRLRTLSFISSTSRRPS